MTPPEIAKMWEDAVNRPNPYWELALAMSMMGDRSGSIPKEAMDKAFDEIQKGIDNGDFEIVILTFDE